MSSENWKFQINTSENKVREKTYDKLNWPTYWPLFNRVRVCACVRAMVLFFILITLARGFREVDRRLADADVAVHFGDRIGYRAVREREREREKECAVLVAGTSLREVARNVERQWCGTIRGKSRSLETDRRERRDENIGERRSMLG